MTKENEMPIVPSARGLMVTGAIGAVVAAIIVGSGLAARAEQGRELATWTADQAVPTVALAKLDLDAAAGTLTLPGTVQPINKAAIYARVSGYLKDWQQDIGAHVKAGQVLATIDTPDLDQQLAQAKADLATADANLQLADLTAKRWRALLASQSVAQQAADEKTGDAAAKRATRDAASANLKRIEALESFKTLTAPFDGVVTARKTDIGALINAGGGAGQELFEVSDLSRVRLYVDVPQAFAAELKPGQKATFELPQYPGHSFDATLVTTSNAILPGQGSMLVQLQADNPDGALEAGAYAEVHFALPGDAHLVRLPATALVPSDHGAEVALLGADGKVAFKPVQLGRDFGDAIEVTSGLSPTDRVVDNPPETLANGDVVRLAADATAVADAAEPEK